MPDISEIIKRAKPRESVVQVFLDGEAAAEVEALERKLGELSDTWQPASLAEQNPAEELARQIQAARERVRESQVDFRMRALSDKAWSDLVAAHPSQKSQELWDPATFPKALVAACCVDPVMTEEQATELFAVLNEGQRGELFQAAYAVNTEATAVPFSVSASGILSSLNGAS